MARNRLPPSNVVVPVIAAFALFIAAIIERDFWLSGVLGIAGVVSFAYAVFMLREYRKSLSEDETK